MITNLDHPDIQPHLERAGSDPLFTRIMEEIKSSDQPYVINPCGEGLEFACTNTIKGVTNRATVKLFYPNPETLVVFFYKKSNVPWSRDRFAYGGIENRLGEGELDKETIRGWLTFAESGFSPEQRPSELTRLFDFDIPS